MKLKIEVFLVSSQLYCLIMKNKNGGKKSVIIQNGGLFIFRDLKKKNLELRYVRFWQCVTHKSFFILQSFLLHHNFAPSHIQLHLVMKYILLCKRQTQWVKICLRSKFLFYIIVFTSHTVKLGTSMCATNQEIKFYFEGHSEQTLNFLFLNNL